MSDMSTFQQLYYQTALKYITYWFHYVTEKPSDFGDFETELANILGAMQKAVEYEHFELLLRTAHHIYSFCEGRGLYDDIETFIHVLQTRFEENETSSELVNNLILLGRLALRREEYDQATSYWEEALQIAREAGYQLLTGELERELGSMKTHRRQYEVAHTHLERSLAIATALDEVALQCAVLGELCRLAYLTGDLKEAETHCEQALILAYRLEDTYRISGLLTYRGALEHDKGRAIEAYQSWQKGLELAKEISNLERIGFLLANLGMVATELEDIDAAESYLREGIELSRKLGNSMVLSHQLMDLGLLLAKIGNLQEANRIMQESITIGRDINDTPLLLFNLSKFGEYHLERGAFEAAKTTFQECLILLEPKVENTARVRITASIHWGMARALTNQGDGEQAREHGQKSLALFQSLKDDRAKEVTQWLYQEGNQYFTGAKSKPGIVDGKDIDHHQ